MKEETFLDEKIDFKNIALKLIRRLLLTVGVISLLLVIIEGLILFYFYDKVADFFFKRYLEHRTADLKVFINNYFKTVDAFLHAKYNEFKSGVWKEEIENSAYFLRDILSKIYTQIPQKGEIKKLILNIIKSYSSGNNFIFVFDKKGKLIFCNYDKFVDNRIKEINKKNLQKIFQYAKLYKTGYYESKFFISNSEKIYLIGYIITFSPLNWTIYIAQDEEDIFTQFRDEAICSIYDYAKHLKDVYIFLYDPLANTFYFCHKFAKDIQNKIRQFILKAHNGEEKYIKPFLVKLGVDKKFNLKYLVLVDLEKKNESIIREFNFYKEMLAKIFYLFFIILLAILIFGFVIMFIYLKYIGKIITNLNKKLFEALKNQQIFLATVSHEIRTPLNAIVGFLNLLYNSELDKTQREYVEKSLISATQLLDLIEDILDTAKIQAGQIELYEEPFDLEEAIKEIVVSLSSRIREGVELKLNLPSLSFYVIGDKKRVKQVFYNIISNAFKFTLKGEVEIGCKEVKEIGSGKVEFLFYVRDTGIGIPKGKQDLLFKPFSQVRTEVHKEISGTGLGLFIAKRLAQLMGGDIWFESEEGKGTTFYIRLILKKGKEKERGGKKVERFKVEKKELKDLRVLVAEDVPTNQLLIREILGKMFGIKRVDIAENGKRAVELALKGNYDLILMDIKMPNMNGFEATEEIRKRGLKVPIYILTADVYKETQMQAKRVGADGFLRKPIEIDKLGEVLKKIVEGREGM